MRLIDKSLFDAVKSGMVDVQYLRFLLVDAGADADERNDYGRTPLLEMLVFVLMEMENDEFVFSYDHILEAVKVLMENMSDDMLVVWDCENHNLKNCLSDLGEKCGKQNVQYKEICRLIEERVRVWPRNQENGRLTGGGKQDNRNTLEMPDNKNLTQWQKYDAFLSVLRDGGKTEQDLEKILSDGVRPPADLLVREFIGKGHKQMRRNLKSKQTEYVEIIPKNINFLLEKELVDKNAVVPHCSAGFVDDEQSNMEYGYSPIMLAVKYGWYNIAEILMKYDVATTIVGDDGNVLADLVRVADKERVEFGLKTFAELFNAKKENHQHKIQLGVGRVKYDWTDEHKYRGGQNLPMSALVTQIVHDWVLYVAKDKSFAEVDKTFNDVRRSKDGKFGYWRDVVVEMDNNPDVRDYPHRFDLANPIVLDGRRYVVNISWGTVTQKNKDIQRDCWGAFLDKARELGYVVHINRESVERMLNTIGRTWFVSYAYSVYVDENHRNWEKRPKFAAMARFYFDKLKIEHKNILQDILDNSSVERLGRNSIDLSGEQVLQMVREILDSAQLKVSG